MELVREWQSWSLLKAHSAGDEKPEGRFFHGPVASENEDFDGEVLEKAGVVRGMEVFERVGGDVDWDHMFARTRMPKWLIGKSAGWEAVNGMPWLNTRLLDGKVVADEAWDHHKAGGRLGYSVFGKAIRNPKNEKRIVDTIITMVTIAAQPKGYDLMLKAGRMPGSLHQISKAIVAGEDIPGADQDWRELDRDAPLTEPTSAWQDTVVKAVNEMGHSARGLRYTIRGWEVQCEKCLSCMALKGPSEFIDEAVMVGGLPLHQQPCLYMSKAFTTGSGIVTSGTMGGAAIRTQCLKGGKPDETSFDGEMTGRKRRRKRTPQSETAKALGVELREMGFTVPDGVAEAIAAKINGGKNGKV